jgi:Kdo2-lipid IVA lauroyltransferase/acyltransferase
MLLRLWIPLLRALRWLPFGAITRLGQILGLTFAILPTRRRRIGRVNLALCFPQLSAAERERLLRRHFVAVAQMLLEYGYTWFAPRERIERLVRVEGFENLRREEGRPVILSMPHFTGLDLVGLRLSLEVPMVSVYSGHKDPALDTFMKDRRQRFDTGMMFRRQSGIRPALRALQQGYRLYYLPDQDHGPRDSVFVDFMGVQAATITGLSRLAELAGAAVLPCYPRRESDGYTLVIEPALADFPSADRTRDARRMNEAIERQVRSQPHQYFWLHRRFKSRPPGSPPIY